MTEIPQEFLCPINLTIMKDPVIMSDGQTYERKAIEKALKISPLSPITKKPLNMEDATTNYSLKSLIQKFLEKGVNGVNTGVKSITLMMTPQGEPYTDSIANELASYDQIIILCGHYEGFDERIREIIKPREISIGDYVLTGGELPALCLIDSVSRKIEGTLGKIESARDDSFSDGLLEYPQYTKPREYRGLKVPEVLLNGNHKLIEEYRMEQKIVRTKAKRPDLWKK